MPVFCLPPVRSKIAIPTSSGTNTNLESAMQLRLGDEESLFQADLSGTIKRRRYNAPERRHPCMRRVATFFEVFVSATLLMSGLYMLHESRLKTNRSIRRQFLIGGAVCFTVGVMTLTSAVRSHSLASEDAAPRRWQGLLDFSSLSNRYHFFSILNDRGGFLDPAGGRTSRLRDSKMAAEAAVHGCAQSAILRAGLCVIGFRACFASADLETKGDCFAKSAHINPRKETPGPRRTGFRSRMKVGGRPEGSCGTPQEGDAIALRPSKNGAASSGWRAHRATPANTLTRASLPRQVN